MQKKWSVFFLFAALILALVASPIAFAQSTGSVSGLVKDPQGSAVPSAKVALTNTETNLRVETESSGDGRFYFGYVNAATYNLTVQKTGFHALSMPVTVQVAQAVDLSVSLEIGQVSETVTVTESAVAINTSNGELAHEISGKELNQLPLLNQNYYNLMLLTPGAVDTGSLTGDTRGSSNSGGGGISVGGARTSSVNFMLDGNENNDTFVAGVAQDVPLDAVQEFKVQSNGASAEYGRNPVVTNVITKSGSNSLHASAYELYRGAALSTAPSDDKASGSGKSNYVRNQFGGSVGGHIIKDKFFYFGSVEGIRVRSSTITRFYVPTQGFLDNSSAPVNTYMANYSPLPTSNCSDSPVTAQYIWDVSEGNHAANGNSTYGTTPTSGLFNASTGALIPAATQLFCRTSVSAPTDGGGGTPQNTWLTTGKFDYVFNPKTTLSVRYAYANTQNPVGAGSVSPYPVFDTAASAVSQNLGITLLHAFSTNLYSEFRAGYNRVHPELPLGQAAGNTPCWQYNGSFFANTPTGDAITFPGYLPNQCFFTGLDVGGPQNVYTGAGSVTWVKGRHTFKFGGSYFHMRHNHTFGAYENGYYESETMNDMLAGSILFFAQALNPQGHVPGEVYDPAVDGPFGPPAFTRHYHYNEVAGFAEDTIRVTPRFTLTLGLRYEYFGVPHSPDGEKSLDANLYLNATGTTTTSDPIYNQVQTARFSRTNQFYKPDYKDLGPRVGLAYDLTGNGRTVIRGGYGLYYDRNFGNATFNAIQNPPNYSVFTGNSTDFFPNPFTINVNEYQMLADAAAEGGGTFTISSSARMLDNNLKTAYSEQWNATVEHNLFGKGIIASASYIGANGIHLYSLNNLNQRGSCLLLLSIDSGPCSSAGPGAGSYRINRSGLTGMNRRGNEGLSRYNALALELKTQEIGKTGVLLFSTYTYSHSIDNESSFFGDSSFEGNWGLGFRDGYNPSGDRSTSSNDIRHRFTLSGIWDIPFMKSQTGFAGHALGGWSLSGVFQAQTGAAFSVYDGSSSSQCNDSGTNFCYPVVTGAYKPHMTTIDTGNSNSFTLYDLTNAPLMTQEGFCAANSLSTPLGSFGNGASVGTTFGTTTYTAAQDNYACTAALANLYNSMTGSRNIFRTPGIWNFDFALAKNIRMPWEGHNLQFRADFANIFNHTNLYANPVTNVYTNGGAVLGNKGVPNCAGVTCGKERRNIQLSLRYSF
jgi:hypothetical protein